MLVKPDKLRRTEIFAQHLRINSQRFAKFARAVSEVMGRDSRPAARLHHGGSRYRFERPNKHRSTDPGLLRNHIHTEVISVNEIDITESRRAKHDMIPFGRAVVRVRRLIGQAMVSLDFDYHAGGASGAGAGL